jgi:hypothetical protein
MRSLLRDRPDISRPQLERMRELMDAHVLDALVEGYEHRIEAITLPDADARGCSFSARVAPRPSKKRSLILVAARLDRYKPQHGTRWRLPRRRSHKAHYVKRAAWRVSQKRPFLRE